ncbi:MAG TPA: alcohol dehydrogenase catalytic domain-containing protein [Opitutaceae bacterium]|nr:alcohol dehydrogenase catalytic domain-containing protein [Opitutaceae bacterium]
MKALVYHGPWQMSVEDLPQPQAGDGEVLLRSVAVGICGSDVHGFTGESGRRKPGMVMGHEAVGEVVSTGPGVARLRVGDRVAVYNIHACGRCVHCLAGQEQLCPEKRILGVNAGQWGAMAEYFAFPESGLFQLDRSLEPAIGLLTEPIAVGLHAINLMRPRPDDVVAIVGAGTIGIGLAVALRARCVKRLFALDKIPAKLALIAEFGAIPINVDSEDANAVVRAATDGRGADGVFEAVGAAATVRTAYDLTSLGGTLVLIGNLAKEFTLPLQGVTSNETTIRGSYGFTKSDFATAVGIVGDPSIPLGRLITGFCSLAETPDVMTRMGRGELNAIKMVIRP